MSSYVKFAFFLFVLVVIGAIAYVGIQQFRGGEITFFSTLFEKHREWLPSLPDWAKLTFSPITPFTVETATSGGSTAPRPTPKPTPVQEPPKPTVVPPQGFTVSQLSPSYKAVSLASVRAAQGNFDTANVTLRADYSLSAPIDITGWVIRGNRGELARIPRAASIYPPSGLLSESDIVLGKGEYVEIYSGAVSPVGRNFRLNQCTGYLNSSFTFNPRLPEACPSMYDRSEIIGLSGECQSFIMSFGGCRIPTTAEVNRYSTQDGGACRSFLDRFGYGSCYNKHNGKSGFLSSEWRVWIRDRMNFDPLHDRVLLYDRSGLLVNEYVY
jgi:hypothetical protein